MTRAERVREMVRLARAARMARDAIEVEAQTDITDWANTCHELVRQILHPETLAALAGCAGPFLAEVAGTEAGEAGP